MSKSVFGDSYRDILLDDSPEGDAKRLAHFNETKAIFEAMQRRNRRAVAANRKAKKR